LIFQISFFPQAVLDDLSEIEGIVTLYKSVEFKLFPGDLSQNEQERNMLMELVLGKREIAVPRGPSSRLGRRITYLFSKESEDAALMGNGSVSVALRYTLQLSLAGVLSR
jgi:hypothetical protein